MKDKNFLVKANHLKYRDVKHDVSGNRIHCHVWNIQGMSHDVGRGQTEVY